MMIKRLIQGAIIAALCLWLPVYVIHAEGENHPVTIAILPCSDVVMTFKKFHPFTEYLEAETGFDIRTVVPKHFAEFEMAIKNGDVDFAFQDPHTYVRTAGLYEGTSLIRSLTREGATFQYGVVIARRDGNIKKLEDLRGKTVMFGPTLSATKWMIAKALFEKNGINIYKDLRAYSHGGCCEDIAFNVFLRAVDAGVVCDHFLAKHQEKQKELGVEAKHLTVVCRTEGVPTRVFAARKGVRAGIVTRINQALLRLDKNKSAHEKILYNAELGGFQRSKDRDYDGIRILIGEKRFD